MPSPNREEIEEGFYIHRRVIDPSQIVDVKDMSQAQKDIAHSRAVPCAGMGRLKFPHGKVVAMLVANDPDGGRSEDGHGHMSAEDPF
ncbi:hypothetical protein AAE478_010462 [Parahypoxylon ruwenzoriense]